MPAEREAEPMKHGPIVVESVRRLLRRGATVPDTIHRDPAVTTGPFVTTAVDLLGLPAFFGVAGPHLVAQ